MELPTKAQGADGQVVYAKVVEVFGMPSQTSF